MLQALVGDASWKRRPAMVLTAKDKQPRSGALQAERIRRQRVASTDSRQPHESLALLYRTALGDMAVHKRSQCAWHARQHGASGVNAVLKRFNDQLLSISHAVVSNYWTCYSDDFACLGTGAQLVGNDRSKWTVVPYDTTSNLIDAGSFFNALITFGIEEQPDTTSTNEHVAITRVVFIVYPFSFCLTKKSVCPVFPMGGLPSLTLLAVLSKKANI